MIAIAALYLLTTGRWGSYVGVPGLPIYIADVLVVLAALQTVRALRRARVEAADLRHSLSRAPLLLLLPLSLLALAMVRFLIGAADVLDRPLLALRDVVPYSYALAALLAFLLACQDRPRQRLFVYAALTTHVGWIILAGYLPGWPWSSPLLGGSPVFTPRPDFDSAVLGVAIALALHELLLSRRPRKPSSIALLVGFAAANIYAVTTLPTRAGFLAGVLSSAVVIGIWAVRVSSGSRSRGRRLRRVIVFVAAGIVVTTGVLFSPPGHRLVEGVQGLYGDKTQASGTIEVRQFVWGGVWDYVTADFTRTAVGVGFGPDFIESSGTAYALEGTEYKDVRSPHNYLVGTLGRLGVAGSLIAGLMLAAGFVAGLRRLAGQPSTVTVLASLLVVGLPVTAMLGVVLESPFGALPYFWAVGHLARTAWDDQTGQAEAELMEPEYHR